MSETKPEEKITSSSTGMVSAKLKKKPSNKKYTPPGLKNRHQIFTVIEIWEDIYVVGNNNFTFKLSNFILLKREKSEGDEKKKRVPIPLKLELNKTYVGDVEKYQKKNLYRLVDKPLDFDPATGKIPDKIVMGVYALILKKYPNEGDDNEILVLRKRNSLKFLLSFKFKLRYELKKKTPSNVGEGEEEENEGEEEEDDIWESDQIRAFLSHFLNDEVVFLKEMIHFYDNVKIKLPKDEKEMSEFEKQSDDFLNVLKETPIFTSRDKKIIKKGLLKILGNENLKMTLLALTKDVMSEFEKRKNLKEEKNLSWGLPGGIPDKLFDRDTFPNNAKQEIKEKTKLLLNYHRDKNAITKPKSMMFLISQSQPLFKHFTIFYIDDKRNEISSKDFSDEFIDFKWVGLQEFKDLIPKLYEPHDEKSNELELDGWTKLQKWSVLQAEMKAEEKKKIEEGSVSSYGNLKIEGNQIKSEETEETFDESIISDEVKKLNERQSSKKKKKITN